MANLIKLSDVKAQKDRLYTLAKQYGVSNIRVFGSVARNTNTAASDVDFLVTLDSQHTLLDLGGFLSDLETIFNCKIDVVPDDSIHPAMKEAILKEAVAV